MRWLTKGLLAMAAVCSVTTGVARAQGARQHDGFYLHLDLGGGGMNTSATQAGTEFEFSGAAGQFSVAVGYNVIPNLIIAGQFWGVSATDPDFEVNGTKVATPDITLGLSAFGLNLTYYFMPINIYVSATPSIATTSLEVGGTTFETDSGFAIRLAAGKEWWVSDNWALGLNLQYAYSSNEDQGPNPPTWKTNFFGVAFSATYD
jgi:hypothetical protein